MIQYFINIIKDNTLDIINLILIISVLIIIYFLFNKFFKTTKKEVKTVEAKKEEIINSYEKQMREILVAHQDDETMRTAKRTQLLKQISKELSTNIFFDKPEVRDIIQKLANLH